MSTIQSGINNGTFQGYATRLDQRVTDPAAFVPVFRRWSLMTDGTDSVSIVTWPGTPEGNIVGDIGSICMDSTNGALYLKTTDTANTGWVLASSPTGALNSIDVDAATGPGTDPVLPTAGQIAILGANPVAQSIPVRTHANTAANRFDVEVQISAAAAATDATQNGLAHFNSAQFTVDANGFVSTIAGTAPWLDSAGGITMANHTGYFATGAAAYTLPVGAANGDMVEIVDQVGGGVVVTAGGTDVIQIQNGASSAGGTATSTLKGDSLRLVFRLADTTWYCCPGAGGTWILA